MATSLAPASAASPEEDLLISLVVSGCPAGAIDSTIHYHLYQAAILMTGKPASSDRVDAILSVIKAHFREGLAASKD